MPSWFKKVFTGGAGKAVPEQEEALSSDVSIVDAPSQESPALGKPDTSDYEQPKAREVVYAPVIMSEDDQSAYSEEVRVKARVEGDYQSCVFMVDRPLLKGSSVWLPGTEWAKDVSPLAEALFAIEGVGTVLIHDFTVTLTLTQENRRSWEEIMREVGTAIRAHLKSDDPVVSQEFLDALPPEDEIRARVSKVIEMEINPGIASHSGVVTLERVDGNSVYITMGGGCQGCAASAITLRQGIHTAFRKSVPELGAIYDETDHNAGTNPYFSELPAGMA
jgi:Fe-S cluster biogenesis protein NfuA